MGPPHVSDSENFCAYVFYSCPDNELTGHTLPADATVFKIELTCWLADRIQQRQNTVDSNGRAQKGGEQRTQL